MTFTTFVFALPILVILFFWFQFGSLREIKKTISELTIQEVIIRSVQFCVCYLVGIGLSCASVALCVRDGGHDYKNIVAITILLSIPTVSNATFFYAFWIYRKSAFNLRCFYSLLTGTGITWILAMVVGAVRSLTY